MREPLAAFWIGFAASAIAAYPIYRLLLALKSRQTVSQYAPEGHQAKQGTPTMGGLIIVVGAAVALAIIPTWASHSFGVRATLAGQPSLGDIESWGQVHDSMAVGTLLLFLSFALIGFIDDFLVPRLIKGKRGLGWKQKIILEIFAGLLAIPALGLGMNPVSIGIALFTVLFFSNAYNFSDGLDGLSGTLGLLLFGGLAAIAAMANGINVSICAAMAGAILPFLFMNAPPAKIFMGDVGSLPIGALLGLEVTRLLLPTGNLDAGGGAPLSISFGVIAAIALFSFVMIAELVPVPMQIFWVKVFKKRLFPYTPIHHAFEKAGWKETRVVFVFAIVQALCVVGAITILVCVPGAH